ncbi:hypothetical protein F4802DRAFT_578101 [Xylaria palmicola]|nr:hypothetical protein F4802DRAFT_578101 [Xylaria palmicola]
MSNAKVLSNKLIGSITQGSRTVQVGYVDRTDFWVRSQIHSGALRDFKKIAVRYIDTLRSDTQMVSLQETPHTSISDNRTHFTAVEINQDGEVTAKRHFYVD